MLVVNHVSDTRYKENAVCSHDNIVVEALCLTSLKDIWAMERYKETEVIFVEEAQFFDDLYEFVKKTVDEDEKHVILCGLDGDFNRQPFRQMVDLIPLADLVEKRSALCIECRDGTVASFSKRIVKSKDLHLIGHSDCHIPVCRYHYLSCESIDS